VTGTTSIVVTVVVLSNYGVCSPQCCRKFSFIFCLH
jgi:hypothetical protein